MVRYGAIRGTPSTRVLTLNSRRVSGWQMTDAAPVTSSVRNTHFNDVNSVVVSCRRYLDRLAARCAPHAKNQLVFIKCEALN